MHKRQMLINDTPGQECRIAIIENGRLDELYQERASAESHVGNIYKGRITHIEPAIQAAFVDFGLERSGFLHISDLHPRYFNSGSKDGSERVGQKTPHRERPPIQSCLRRGQEILVQVLKEGIGSKGPTLTSYLSIPGRFLVMLPYMQRAGVSRKVEDDEARQQMRKVLNELDPPKEFGFIIRTAGIGRTKMEIKRDLAYLQRLWKAIDQRLKSLNGVGELYTESDLVIRTIRDVFSSDIQRIIVDSVSAARRVKSFLMVASPRSGSRVVVYDDPIPLFHRYGIEQQIENIHGRVVPLKSGGSLVIDSTEALVAIDVNSGKSRDSRDAETMAFKTDLEAADEVCRQLRLRDLGGVVVIDLIDMRSVKHRREVEQRFKNNLKRDRARTQVSPISQFGILEMTRQRMRPSLKKAVHTDCTACHGAGQVKTPESVVLDVMRRLAVAMHHQSVVHVELTISPDVAFQLLNHWRRQLAMLEQQHQKAVTVRVGGRTVDYIELNAFDTHGGKVDAEKVDPVDEKSLKSVEDSLHEQQESPTPITAAGYAPPPSSPEDAVRTQQDQDADTAPKPTRRKRRRRGGRSKSNSSPPTQAQTASDKKPPTPNRKPKKATASEAEPAVASAQDGDSSVEATTNRPRRRRRRGGSGRGRSATQAQTASTSGESQTPQPAATPIASEKKKTTRTSKPRRRRSSAKPKPIAQTHAVKTDTVTA